MKQMKNVLFALALVIAAVFFCGCMGQDEPAPIENTPAISGVVTVFHAGSLTVPFEELEAAFEAAYPGTDVRLVPGGSTKMVKEITDLDKSADVLASADYTLIPSLMMPDYADWYVTFAKNRMVLCYTDESLYADEVNADNWYTILEKSDVAWAFSDPNLDPCGYRSLMTMKLAETHYGDDTIFERLVVANSAITVSVSDEVSTIHATSPEPKGKLQIRPKSVELVQMLQSGGLDYAWEYRSVAVQHNLKFIELPEAIDLSSIEFESTYATVIIDTEGGMMTGKPIVYGATVPDNSENPAAGLAFIEMLIDSTGNAVMDGQGQPPIVPAGGYGNIPAELKGLTATS
ncbi:molybdenum ABC transporter substrate-binding protein [Methanocalculus chunghsingensis]|uniref:Molybdenum ABC transporter substrate-binding protein n=1 Tax=Methanocalculus chunghsingensis TaxID=156457 RepID=A0A8J7W6E6_9EURY|nr:tungstate ABC transporter substrate-binding protein WtpA [Methanocalculus chunghsingensis]MBR1369214.1 molybdenum ABC transporter substrate-binding protein [Methanocalculus chunghsingensis]